MYLGMWLILAGTAILLKSVLLLLVPVSYGWLMQAFYIRIEERWLEQELGDPYRQYKKRVRRWVGRK